MAHKTTIATKEKNERLYRAILALETEEECYAFFQDLCTIAELRSMEQRYEVATLLSEGMVVQRHTGAHRRLQRHHQSGEPGSPQRDRRLRQCAGQDEGGRS